MSGSLIMPEAGAEIVSAWRSRLASPVGEAGGSALVLAVFAAVLGWVMQHARKPQDSVESDLDHRAFALGDRLRRDMASSPPWSIGEAQIVPAGLPFAFPRLTADQVLGALRNTLAHAEASTVVALHGVAVAGRGDAVAFRFGPSTHIDIRSALPRHQWYLTLSLEDMRRIGLALADAYLGGGEDAMPRSPAVATGGRA